jgi:hypothetical protein
MPSAAPTTAPLVVTLPLVRTFIGTDNQSPPTSVNFVGPALIGGSPVVGRELLRPDGVSIPLHSCADSMSAYAVSITDTAHASGVVIEMHRLTRPYDPTVVTWYTSGPGATWTVPGGDYGPVLTSAPAVRSGSATVTYNSSQLVSPRAALLALCTVTVVTLALCTVGRH